MIQASPSVRIEQLHNFQRALENSKGRGDAFNALTDKDRKNILNVLVKDKITKPNNPNPDWNKAGNVALKQITKLLAEVSQQTRPIQLAKQNHLQAARTKQLVNFQKALEANKERSNKFQVLNEKDRKNILNELVANNIIKKNSSTIDWNKARTISLKQVTKLLAEASKQTSSTQEVTKKIPPQLVSPKQMSSVTRIQHLNIFRQALEGGKGRTDAYKALAVEDRRNVLQTLIINKLIKNDKAVVDWNKARTISLKQVTKLLAEATKQTRSTQEVTKKILPQLIGSKQLMTNSRLTSFLTAEDLRSLQNISKKTTASITANALHIIKAYELKPLIDSYCHTSIKSNAAKALDELMALAEKLSKLEKLEHPTYHSIKGFFALVEAGNLLRIMNDYEDIRNGGAEHQILPMKTSTDQEGGQVVQLSKPTDQFSHAPIATIADLLNTIGNEDILLQEAEKIRTRIRKTVDQLGHIDFECNLSGLELTLFPKEFCQFKNTTALVLNYNRLVCLPKEFSQLKTLTRLALTSNQFKVFPSAICKLKALVVLDLSLNLLEDLPKEIRHLKALTFLDLEKNRLKHLLKEIGQLQALTDLMLSYNLFTSLPKELGQLQTLTRLYLRNNLFTNTPKEIYQLKNLSKLSLDNNLLTNLPTDLGEIPGLKKHNSETQARLSFMGNGIIHLPVTLLEYEDQLPYQDTGLVAKAFFLKIKNALKTNDCKTIAIIFRKFKIGISSGDNFEILGSFLTDILKADPKWSKATRIPHFCTQAFTNPKIEPQLKLQALERFQELTTLL